MFYLDFLKALHGRLAPPTYLEIGIRHGDSLALASRRRRRHRPVLRPAGRAARRRQAVPRDERRVLRPRHAARAVRRPPRRVLVHRRHAPRRVRRARLRQRGARRGLDERDRLRRRATRARSRRPRATAARAPWTGDVYKALAALERHRPDLVCLRVDTRADRARRRARARPARPHAATSATTRSSPSPSRRIRRTSRAACSRAPARSTRSACSTAGFWDLLRKAREQGTSRRRGIHALRRAVRKDLGVDVPRPRLVDLRHRVSGAQAAARGPRARGEAAERAAPLVAASLGGGTGSSPATKIRSCGVTVSLNGSRPVLRERVRVEAGEPDDRPQVVGARRERRGAAGGDRRRDPARDADGQADGLPARPPRARWPSSRRGRSSRSRRPPA